MSYHSAESFVSDASSDSETSSDSKGSSFNLLEFYNNVKWLKLLHTIMIMSSNYKDNLIYERAREFLISGFPEKTTIEDLRKKFSIYGDIKDCYLLSNLEEDRKASIIFYESNSGMKAIKHVKRNRISLHHKVLTVSVKLVNLKDLQLYLENHRGNTVIDEFNDDCLLEIFKYLTISERLKLRRVCTRWRSLANVSLRTMQHLDFRIDSKDINNFKNIDYEKQLQGCIQKLRGVMETTSYYRGYNYEISAYDELAVIASLHIHFLAVNCKNLTKLIVTNSTHDERILSHIFKMNQGLRHIEIHSNQYITGESLHHLSEKVHTFIVEGCRKLNSNNLSAAVKRFKHLKCLKLTILHNDNLSGIFNECYENLETLHLNFSCECHIEFDSPISITNHKKVRDFIISGFNGKTETVCVNLREKCQKLKYLKLEGLKFQEYLKITWSAIDDTITIYGKIADL